MEFCFQCGGPIAAGSASCGTCGANPECILKITHDIEVDDELAFKQGDLVVIRQISPNESRPQFKYVVYSETMKKFFQLSDNDLSQSIVTLETPPVDVESTRSSKLASSPDTKRQMEAIIGEPQVQQAASGRRLYRAIGITAAILFVTLVAIGIIYVVKRSGVKATDEQIKREYLVYVGTVDDFVQSIDSYYSGFETEGHSRLEYIRDAMESKLVSRLRKYINENEVKVESYRPKSEKLQRVRSELRGYSEKSLNLAEASLESLGSSNGINGNTLTKLTDDYNGLADVLKTVIGSRLRDYSQMKDGEGSYVKTNSSISNPTTYHGKFKEFVEKTNSAYSAMAECGLSLSRDLEGITSSTMGNQQLAEYNARIDSAIAAYQGFRNEFDSVKNQLATMTPDNGFEQVQDTMIAALTSFVDGVSEILTGLDLYKGMDETRTDQGGVLVNSGAAHIVEGADYIKLATQQYADAMP